MQVNTKQRTVRMTKSETDRIREAAYIVRCLKSSLSMLDMADGETIRELGGAEFLLEVADKYGFKEKVTT